MCDEYVAILPSSGQSVNRTYKSLKASRERSAVNTSNRPITWRREGDSTHAGLNSCLKDLHVPSNSSTCINKPGGWYLKGTSASHVFMFHVLEEPQLSVGPLGEELRLERSVELLDGHLGSGSVVHRWAESKKNQHEPQNISWWDQRWSVISAELWSSDPLIRASHLIILSYQCFTSDIIQSTVQFRNISLIWILVTQMSYKLGLC